MAEPLREQALAKIVELLRGMTGLRLGPDGQPWGQYPTDPIVRRGYLDEAQVNEFPAIFVARRAGSTIREDQETTVGTAIGLVSEFLIDIFGYVQSKDGVLASTWLERLYDDVVTTLLANWTLGGVAQTLRFDGEDDYDEDEIKAGFRLGVRVVLYESKGVA